MPPWYLYLLLRVFYVVGRPGGRGGEGWVNGGEGQVALRAVAPDDVSSVLVQRFKRETIDVIVCCSKKREFGRSARRLRRKVNLSL